MVWFLYFTGFYMVLDNASCHKSKTIREYVESAGDDIALEFLPPYTPQLNPIETAWRDLKRRLAGRHFRSTDELKRAITTIVECEMGNRLKYRNGTLMPKSTFCRILIYPKSGK